MPNQLNYPEKITSTINQRPFRLSNKDVALMRNSDKQILFGTDTRDNVELWMYTVDGRIAAHLNLDYNDTALTLTTVVDQSGTYELLNVDMTEVIRRLTLDPGRYVLVGNFFRDEVGSEKGYKLFISEISDDRTELRLEPVTLTTAALHDIYEFVEPSVPREFAQGLMAEMLGTAINQPVNETVNVNNMYTALNSYKADTMSRIIGSGMASRFTQILTALTNRTYTRVLDLMAKDSNNLYVQEIEVSKYINTAMTQVLGEMVAAGEINPEFQII